MSESSPPSDARRIAGRALLATAGLYGGYAVLGLVGLHPDLRYLALVGAFYFLPQWMLKDDEDRQARYQVGPGGVVPPWDWRGARVAGLMALAVFPPFVLGFFWFYAQVCSGDLTLLSPVIAVESLTPAAGGLETYLSRLCRAHNGAFWPDALHLPADWLRYGGLATVLAVAIEVFAIALPEEVFHRGYLMSALEELWPPKVSVLGAKLGLGALAASALFAVGHLVGMAEVARLATFFPALVFSWLWRRSNTLWAPALFHAASNLLMAVLLASTFPR
ncbi:MAG: MrtZ family glutamic-type intramembrane protease [Myxococcota bacterium]